MKRLSSSNRLFKQQHGFTLVELIMIIVVLGILVLSVTAKYKDLSDGAERATCIANQLSLEQAQTLFYSNCLTSGNAGHYADNLNDLIPFISGGKIPECPGGGTYSLLSAGKISCSKAEHNR